MRKKWKKAVSGFRAVGASVLTALFVTLARGSTVYATTKIEKSKLAEGTQKLITEMDQKKWNSRIVTAIVSCIGAVIGSATLGIIVGYYK